MRDNRCGSRVCGSGAGLLPRNPRVPVPASPAQSCWDVAETLALLERDQEESRQEELFTVEVGGVTQGS